MAPAARRSVFIAAGNQTADKCVLSSRSTGPELTQQSLEAQTTVQTGTAGAAETQQTARFKYSLRCNATTALMTHSQLDESCVSCRFNPFSGAVRAEGSRWVLQSLTSVCSHFNIILTSLA